jgi:hypothetical protein
LTCEKLAADRDQFPCGSGESASQIASISSFCQFRSESSDVKQTLFSVGTLYDCIKVLAPSRPVAKSRVRTTSDKLGRCTLDFYVCLKSTPHPLFLRKKLK